MNETPPEMFQRPTDPPDLPAPLCAGDEIGRLHTEWARMHPAAGDTDITAGRLRNRVTTVAQIARGADHRLIGDLIRAVDAIAARVDELSERVNTHATTTHDVARVLSEELSQLKADLREMGGPGDRSRPAR